ncbi:MAG: hypothetical protein JW984_13815 [Deltaproteobacteria bacterium]|uniref:3-hydroxyacyl-CoA dehydrogenase n=1 Tax=Candidatus Zymogenus saltonus TaxID=2844893 RepID=A0A9D8KFT6_9DELT|nr:hypothetical protein [Candidatus Zymogenus saltonus]
MAGEIKTVAIIGAGFMGSQIASRAAVYGYDVRLFDIKKEVIEAARGTTKYHNDAHFAQHEGDSSEADKRITFHEKLEDAVKDADLVIEAVAESVEVKRKVFSEMDEKTPPYAIFGTNSSSLPVSMIEDAVERLDKVANIHFASPIPERYYVEIMRGTKTTEETINAAEEWVRSIKCLPLITKKECMGFVVNRVWRAIKKEALKIWAEDDADIRDVDRGWMIFSGMSAGPFGAMDFVGLDVVYDIEMAYYNDTKDPKDKPPDALKEMIDRGELGMKSGKGFYDWSDIEFAKPGFLDPVKK